MSGFAGTESTSCKDRPRWEQWAQAGLRGRPLPALTETGAAAQTDTLACVLAPQPTPQGTPSPITCVPKLKQWWAEATSQTDFPWGGVLLVPQLKGMGQEWGQDPGLRKVAEPSASGRGPVRAGSRSAQPAPMTRWPPGPQSVAATKGVVTLVSQRGEKRVPRTESDGRGKRALPLGDETEEPRLHWVEPSGS